MAKKLVVNLPNMYKGAPVEVLYLGEFPNGGEYELTDAQIETYEALMTSTGRGGADENGVVQPYKMPRSLMLGDKDAKLSPAPKVGEVPVSPVTPQAEFEKEGGE